MTHDNLRELMLLYIANALTPDERAEIEMRLNQQDPSALAALAEAESTVSHIALDAAPITPSADMWSKLEQKLRSDGGNNVNNAGHVMQAASLRRQPWLTGIATAAIIAITAGITYWLSTYTLGSDENVTLLRDQIASTTNKLEQTEQALSSARESLNQAESKLARRLDEVAQQRQLIDTQREQIDAHDQVVSVKDEMISSQSDQIDRQRQTIDASRGQLAQREMQLTQLQADLDATKATIKRLRDHIESLEQELRNEQLKQNGSQIVGDPRESYTQVASMAGDEKLMPTAKARATWDESNFRLSLQGEGFQQLPAGKTYQLWFVTDKQETVSLGTFDIQPDGSVQYDTTYARLANSVAAVAVSIEDIGGQLSAPAGDVVVVGTPRKSDG